MIDNYLQNELSKTTGEIIRMKKKINEENKKTMTNDFNNKYNIAVTNETNNKNIFYSISFISIILFFVILATIIYS
jgi:hypothetical protein